MEFLLSLFIYLFMAAPRHIWKFPGQGSNPSRGCGKAGNFNALSQAGDRICTSVATWVTAVEFLTYCTPARTPCQVFLFYLFIFLAPLEAYGSSWAKDWIQTTAVTSAGSLTSCATRELLVKFTDHFWEEPLSQTSSLLKDNHVLSRYIFSISFHVFSFCFLISPKKIVHVFC